MQKSLFPALVALLVLTAEIEIPGANAQGSTLEEAR